MYPAQEKMTRTFEVSSSLFSNAVWGVKEFQHVHIVMELVSVDKQTCDVDYHKIFKLSSGNKHATGSIPDGIY